MNLREPAGGERRGGNSAEFPVRARAGDGSSGNTGGTVRGPGTAGALSADIRGFPCPGERFWKSRRRVMPVGCLFFREKAARRSGAAKTTGQKPPAESIGTARAENHA